MPLPCWLPSLLQRAAHAQRIFQTNALRGELVLKAPPEALLNGKPARLAPGARIRNQQT